MRPVSVTNAFEKLPISFWGALLFLLASSSYMGWHAEQQRQALQGAEGHIESGTAVSLARVIDGDTLIVLHEQQEVTVRMLGIKAFDTALAKRPETAYAKSAIEAIKRLAREHTLTIYPNGEKDRQKRTVARVFIDDKDMAIALLEQGHVLAYPIYPFQELHSYLLAEESAREQHLGLWSNPEVSQLALNWKREWKQDE